MQEIYQHGPVTATYTVYEDFYHYNVSYIRATQHMKSTIAVENALVKAASCTRTCTDTVLAHTLRGPVDN